MITKHKKKIILLAIILLLAPGFLSYGFNNKKPGKNSLVSQTQLCCCGNNASCCQDCTCSEGLAESVNIGKYTVTITSCGGSSDDIFTALELNYFLTQSAFFNYLPATTLSEAILLKPEYSLLSPPYKPPKT